MSKRNTGALQMITANRLRDGVVIYLQIDGEHHHWCDAIGDGSIFDQSETEAQLARAAIDVRQNRIVDPYTIAVTETHVPLTQREAVRAGGPTIAYAL